MIEMPHPVTFPHVDEISKNSGREFRKPQAERSSMRLRASSVQKAGLLVVRLERGGCPRVPGGRQGMVKRSEKAARAIAVLRAEGHSEGHNDHGQRGPSVTQ